MVFLLFILLFMSIFAGLSVFVLYYKAAEESKKLIIKSNNILEKSKKYQEAYTKIKNAPQIELQRAKIKAEEIILLANKKAEEIAGTSLDLLKNATKYEQIATAMKNKIYGYGNEYLVPLHKLIDELGFEFEHTSPGKKLKEAKELIKKIIKNGSATESKCIDNDKAQIIGKILLDAFISKTEIIMELTKSDNYGKLKQEITDAFILANKDGEHFEYTKITDDFKKACLDQLKWACLVQGIKVEQREEQKRIREQIREEEKVLREIEKTKQDAVKEEEVLQTAMALAHEKLGHANQAEKAKLEQQIKELGDKLILAEEKGKKALSMAQQTKSGHVYVISNIGSFGENVFKIGLTRRLEPLDRIRELGDSSVPFEFDVHALIKAEDAPALENKLHKHFVMNQINKVNHRKEFFNIPLTTIKMEIEKLKLEAKWTMIASAQEYRETLVINNNIKNDTNARESWIKRQLELDPTDIKGSHLIHENLDFDTAQLLTANTNLT